MTSAISDSVIEGLLARVSIRDVIAPYVKLQQRGSRFVGLCPFHDETTPSFSVNEAKGVYHCFACKASGNALRFIMQKEAVSFDEAVQKLAELSGEPSG